MIRALPQPVTRFVVRIWKGDECIAGLDPETPNVDETLEALEADTRVEHRAEVTSHTVSAEAQLYLVGAAQAWAYAYAFAVRFRSNPPLTRSAIAAALHFRTVRLQTWGYDCPECLGECEVFLGMTPKSPAPYGSPAEAVYGDCPTCRGSGLVLPKKGSRLDVTV